MSTIYSIRRATTKDLKSIQELNIGLMKSDARFDPELFINWPYTKAGRRYYRRSLSHRRAHTWIAEEGGKAIGYLVGWVWLKRAYRPVKTAELENLYVVDEHRSRGVGAALVGEFINWCVSRKIRSVEVWANSGNTRAHKFYQSHGFRPLSQKFELKIKN